MGTIITATVLIAVIIIIIAKIIRDKKNGKSSCNCNCGNCPYSEQCHSKKK